MQAVGINENENLTVENAEGATVSNGRLITDLVAGERTSITIDFEEAYDGPIEISASIHNVTSEEQ